MPGKPRSMKPGRKERVEELKTLVHSDEYLNKAVERLAENFAEKWVEEKITRN